MYILDAYCKNEIIIKKSCFLAEGFVLDNAGAVRDILKSQKNKYKDARHVVHAFVIGKEASIQGSSDDGEPKGTAGRPALLVLQHSNVTNIMLTITRWFGGILLGTGGLVKAYTESAKELLNIAVLKELKNEKYFRITCIYKEITSIQYFLDNNQIVILEKRYTQNAEFLIKVVEDNIRALITYIENNTRALIEEISPPNLCR